MNPVQQRKSWRRVLCIAAVVAAVASASGSDGDASGLSGVTESGATTTPGEPANTVGGTDVASTERPVDSTDTRSGDATPTEPAGSATIVVKADQASLDPVTFSGVNRDTSGQRGIAIFDVLVYEDPVSGSVVPSLAESLTTEDGTVWQLRLRPDLEFSDGTPLDAEAVKFNWERVQDPENKSPAAGVANAIASMDVVSPTELAVTLTTPQSQFDRQVAFQLSMIGSPTALENDPQKFAENPIGAGPFIVSSYVRNDKMVLTRNPNYWNAPRPYLEQLTIQVIPDTAQGYNAMVTGQAQAVRMISGSVFLQAEDAGYSIAETGELLNGGYDLLFNNSIAPFNDARVRRAVAMGVDTEQLVATIFSGYSQPIDSLFQDSSPYYTGTTYNQYDPIEAQKLFDEVASETGGPVTFSIGATQGEPSQMAEYIQTVLASFDNVEVSLDSGETSAFVGSIIQGTYQAAVWVDVTIDADPQMYNRYRSGLPTNFARYENPEMDEALDTLHTSLSQDERTAAYAKVEELLIADRPVWYFARSPQGFVYDPKALSGVELMFDGVILVDRLVAVES